MSRFTNFLTILTLFISFSGNSLGQDTDGKPTCTDEVKLRELVKKGVMTKETCFKFIDNSLKLNVTGRTYGLAEVRDLNLSEFTSTKDGKKVCVSDIQKKNYTSSNSEQDKLSTEALDRFGLFIDGLNQQIEKLKTMGRIKSSDQITISSEGYADGVRVPSSYMDQIIFNEIGIEDYSKIFNLYGVTASSFKEKQSLFSKIVCPNGKAIDNSIKTSNFGLRNNKRQSLRNDLRNVGIARKRSNNLLKLVKANINAKTTIVSNSTGIISSKIRTDGANCKGYCSMRRGAELRINIPGLVHYSVEVKKTDATISPIFNTPADKDQQLLNKIAVQTLVKDFDTFILSNLQSNNKPIKKMAIQAFNFLINFHSVKSVGKEYVYFLSPTDLADPAISKGLDKYLTSLMNIKFSKEDFSKNNNKKHLITKYNKYQNDYFSFIKNAKKKIIDKNQKNLYALMKEFLKYKYKMNDKDLKEFNEIVNWTYFAFLSGLKDTHKMSYSDPEKIKDKKSILYYKEPDLIKIKSTLHPTGNVYNPVVLGVYPPKIKFVGFIAMYVNKLRQAMVTKAASNPNKSKKQSFDFTLPRKEVEDLFKKNFPEVELKLSKAAKDKDKLDPITDIIQHIAIDTMESSIEMILQNEEESHLTNSRKYLKELSQKYSGVQYKELKLIIVTLEKFIALFHRDVSRTESERGFTKYHFANKMKVSLSFASNTSTTIFSFLDYRDGYAAIINNSFNNDLTHRFTKKAALKQALQTISKKKNVVEVFFKPKSILSSDDDSNILFTGFFHHVCKTGTYFRHDPKKNDRFHYQSRVVQKGSRKNYTQYESNPNLYDKTYYISEQAHTEIKNFNLLALKHPTSYLIPNCKSCGCLKKQVDGTNVTGDYLAAKLSDKNTISLNFWNEYKWLNDGKDETIVKGNKKHSQYAVKSYDKNALTSLVSGREGSIQGTISSKYCLYSPTVPQSHDIGEGKATQQSGESNDDNDNESFCPIVDALASVDNMKLNSDGYFDAAGNELTEDQINDVINVCQQVVDNFPMDEKDCQNPKLNNKCLFVNDKIKREFNIIENDPRCMASSDTVNYGTENSFCTGVLLKY